jgi:membrane-bound ClpP family serine protease|tara:strand:- start:704 stop:883 length:180 start_codon:yes stop_codon:yes gene_type:complete
MRNFWNPNNYDKLFNLAVFLIILGGILSIIELLTENSGSIFMSGVVLLVLLAIFKSRFR